MFHLCQRHLKSSTATETFLFFFFFFDLQLYKGPSLPNLFKKSKDSDLDGSSTGPEEETSFGSEYSGGKRVRDRLLIGARPVPRNAASFLPERETQKRRKTNISFPQQSPQGSNSSTSTEFAFFDGVSGELELCLTYSSSASCLEITVGACRNLPSRGPKRKKCHP